jgi:hypothetical protein
MLGCFCPKNHWSSASSSDNADKALAASRIISASIIVEEYEDLASSLAAADCSCCDIASWTNELEEHGAT